jgi:hypothetical protein
LKRHARLTWRQTPAAKTWRPRHGEQDMANKTWRTRHGGQDMAKSGMTESDMTQVTK